MLTRAEQDELIVSHLPQAHGIALRIYNRIGHRMPLEDLQQYGCLGLCLAAAKFDPAMGWLFKTFAEYRIRGAIVDGIRRETRSRLTRDGGEPEYAQTIPLDAVYLGRPDPLAGRDIAAFEAKRDIARLSKGLTLRERAVVNNVCMRERSQSEVAAEMGFHPSRLSQFLIAARNHMAASA